MATLRSAVCVRPRLSLARSLAARVGPESLAIEVAEYDDAQITDIAPARGTTHYETIPLPSDFALRCPRIC